MIKRWLGVLGLVCGLAGSLCAQNTTTFGNIVSQGTPCGSSNCVYYQLPPGTPWVAITVSGTWTGTLETATTSAPNANYSNLSTLAWTVLATNTANGTWTAATSGATYLRVRATSWSGGLARVDMSASQTGSPTTNPILPGTVTVTGLRRLDGGAPSICWFTDGTFGSCGGASNPAGPAQACNFANSAVTGFQGDISACSINPTTHNLNGNINSVINGAALAGGPMVASPLTAPWQASVVASSNVLTCVGCTFPNPMTGYVAHLGDEGNGELDVTLTYLSPTTATMNLASTWTTNNGVTGATVAAGGSGYAVGDTGTINGGTGVASIYQISSISGGGATGPATGVTIVRYGGGYTNASAVATTPGQAQPGSGSGLTLNITTTLQYETLYLGPDNCTAANAWLNAVVGGRGILPAGYYMSSCPILQASGNPVFIEGTSFTNTHLVDADPSSHADFVAIGFNGGNVISQINNIEVIANGNVTRGGITVYGGANATMNNVSVPESGASAFYFNNGVGETYTNIISRGAAGEIARPVNCISVHGNVPEVLVSPVCEGMTGYDIVTQGNVGLTITGGQIDLSRTGLLDLEPGSYATLVNTGMLCEEWTCTESVKDKGILTSYTAGIDYVHVYNAGVLNLFDGSLEKILADSGSNVKLSNIRSDPTAFVDNTGMWFDGPTVGPSTTLPIIYAPQFQHPSSVAGGNGHGTIENNGGGLIFHSGCNSFGTATCRVDLLSYTIYPTSAYWKISFQGQWNDGSHLIAFNNSCSASSPTFTVNTFTVTCAQNPTTFTNNFGQTIFAGQYVAYVPAAAADQVAFLGGTWTVYPDGDPVLYDYSTFNIPQLTTPFWFCDASSTCTVNLGAQFAHPFAVNGSAGPTFKITDTTNSTWVSMQAFHGSGSFTNTSTTNPYHYFQTGSQYTFTLYGLMTWIGNNNNGSAPACFIELGPQGFCMNSSGLMQFPLLTASSTNNLQMLSLDPSHNVASTTLKAEVAGSYAGVPPNSQVMAFVPVSVGFFVPSNCAGSYGGAKVAATSTAVFIAVKHAGGPLGAGTTLCSFTFSASGTVAAVTGGGGSVVDGDYIEIDAPGTADATLATIGIGMGGIRTE